MKKIFILFLFCIFFVGCNEIPEPQEEEKTNYLDVLNAEYELFVGEELNLKNIISVDDEIKIESNSASILVEGKLVKAIEKGEASIIVRLLKEEKNVKIIVKEKADFEIKNMTLYLGEVKELEINIIKGDISKLQFECNNNNVSY